MSLLSLYNFLILFFILLFPAGSQNIILTLNIDDCVNCNRMISASIGIAGPANEKLTIIVQPKHRRQAEKYLEEIVGAGKESYLLTFSDDLYLRHSLDERSTFSIFSQVPDKPVWQKKAVEMTPADVRLISAYFPANVRKAILWNEDSSYVISDAYAIVMQEGQPVIADLIYGSVFRPGHLPAEFTIKNLPWKDLYTDVFGNTDAFSLLMSYKQALGNLTEPKLVNAAADVEKLVLAFHLPYLHAGKDSTDLALDYQSCLLAIGTENEILSVTGPQGLYHQFTYGFTVSNGNAISKSHQKYHEEHALLTIVKNIYNDPKPKLVPDLKTKLPALLISKLDTTAYQFIGFKRDYLFFRYMPLAIHLETQHETVFEELRIGRNIIIDIFPENGRIFVWAIYDQQQILRFVYDETTGGLKEWSFIADATAYKTYGQAIDADRLLILNKSDQLVKLAVEH